MYCTHEEADSRMLFHLKSLSSVSNVVSWTSDTDVLLIALSCWSHFNEDINLWLEVGLSGDNSLRYISVNQLFAMLGSTLCNYLAFHLKLLEQDKSIQEVFGEMGINQIVTEEQMKNIETFVCKMYGHKKESSIDYVRLEMFLKKYKPKKDSGIISCAKKMGGM